jgi:hypothetical protein
MLGESRFEKVKRQRFALPQAVAHKRLLTGEMVKAAGG